MPHPRGGPVVTPVCNVKQINDPSPRFNQKFDFIDVPAISHFTATVYDKSGLIESRLSMTPWKQVRTPPHNPGFDPSLKPDRII